MIAWVSRDVSQRTIKKDITWLILCNFLIKYNTKNLDVYNENKRIDTWNAFNSLLVQPPVRTNHGVVAPLLRSPPTSPQTLYTALCLAQKINLRVLGDGRSTVITLNLDLYERAVKIRANRWNKGKLILRLGELHIMFALLKALGKFIEGSGIDDIWIESGLYGAVVTRQIFSGKFLKRGVEAHLVNLIALMTLYFQSIEENNDAVTTFLDQMLKSLNNVITSRNREQVGMQVGMEVELLAGEVEKLNLFEIFNNTDVENRNEIASFLYSYMKQIMNLLKFIRSTREGDFTLHLTSLDDNIKYFFAHDLYKYARLSPYYLVDMDNLRHNDNQTWKSLLPEKYFLFQCLEFLFCGLGVDQGLEQEIRALKVSGGVIGITQNKSALDRYFLIAPELLRILDSFWEQYGKLLAIKKNIITSKVRYQRESSCGQ